MSVVHLNQQKYKVMIDLSLGITGYTGIAQDTRLVFKTLALLNEVKLAGLLIANNLNALRCKLNPVSDKAENIVQQCNFMSNLLTPELPDYSPTRIKYLYQKYQNKQLLKRERTFPVSEIDPHFAQLIWRSLFAKTLQHDDLALITSQQFLGSHLNFQSMLFAVANNLAIDLDTSAWDFMIFQDLRPVTVRPNTVKIIRYHDAIPITDIDMIGKGDHEFHSQVLLKCRNDSFFVCNSTATRDSLLSIIPDLENKSATIPYALPIGFKKQQDRARLLRIVNRRLSSQILKTEKIAALREQLAKEDAFPYILTISTLQPRKNQLSLIRAWEILRDQKGIKHKLIIVANPGWKNQEIISAMEPHIESGDIIHLDNVTPDEMPFIYSHAAAFVFPSYSEGFGLPPMEAMQCECPVVVSDISAHRAVLSDAAIYSDPYNVHDIANAIEQLIIFPEAEKLREQLIQKGLERVALYTPERVGQQWLSLFEQLKKPRA